MKTLIFHKSKTNLFLCRCHTTIQPMHHLRSMTNLQSETISKQCFSEQNIFKNTQNPLNKHISYSFQSNYIVFRQNNNDVHVEFKMTPCMQYFN